MRSTTSETRPTCGDAVAWESADAIAPPGHGRAFAVGIVVAAFLSTVALGWFSEGTHHADDITHHLMARWAWRDGRFLLDNWGRPGFTILYFPLAWTGMFGSRLTSALLSAAAAWLAYLTADRLPLRRPYLVPLLLYVQPMFTRLAYTSLTETVLAFYLILALWLWVTDRPVWSAAVISLGMVTRHEACVFLALWGVALLVRRRWRLVAVLAWAPLAHNLLARLFLGYFPFQHFLQPSGDVQFGTGTLFHYAFRLSAACGLGLVPLALGGLLVVARRRGGLLVVASVAAYFAVETALFAMGRYSSGGYTRFLVPMCPALAVGACAAVDFILDGRGRAWLVAVVAVLIGGLLIAAARVEADHATRHTMSDVLYNYRLLFLWSERLGKSLAAVAVVVGALVVAGRASAAWRVLRPAAVVLFFLALLQTAGMNEPYRLGPVEEGLKRAAQLVRDRYPGRRVIRYNPWYAHFADEYDIWGNTADARDTVEEAPVGAILVWDWALAASDYHKLTEEWLAERPWLKEVWEWEVPTWDGTFAYVRIFEKVAPSGDGGELHSSWRTGTFTAEDAETAVRQAHGALSAPKGAENGGESQGDGRTEARSGVSGPSEFNRHPRSSLCALRARR